MNRSLGGIGQLVMALALAGCGSSSPVTAPENRVSAGAQPVPSITSMPSAAAVQASCHPAPLTGAAALLGPFTVITPTRALKADALNARVCWGGGLRTLQAVSQERDCMLLLQFENSEKTGVRWPQENHFFKACGRGPYDRQLLEQFTLVWVSGKVTGQAEFAGTPIPVIEIDALYRGSDCLEGDTSPQCVHDYLQPLKKPQ